MHRILVLSGKKDLSEPDEWADQAVDWLNNHLNYSGFFALRPKNQDALDAELKDSDLALIIIGGHHFEHNIRLVPDDELRQKTMVLDAAWNRTSIDNVVRHLKAGFFDYRRKMYSKEEFLPKVRLSLLDLDDQKQKKT